MGMCCEKKMMIGWRNVWSMKLRVQDQEEDQRGPGEREVVRQDRQARKMNKEDAIDLSKWRKMIKDVRWSGWIWVGVCFFWYRPTRVVPDQRLLNGCVCVVRNYWSKRQWVAVASAGLYASLHLPPDWQPRKHPITQFLRPVWKISSVRCLTDWSRSPETNETLFCTNIEPTHWLEVMLSTQYCAISGCCNTTEYYNCCWAAICIIFSSNNFIDHTHRTI